MFDKLFGWRKASKCKKLIMQARCRLKQLKNKRSSIVRQAREDIASLLRSGREADAFNRVDQLCKDENGLAVYELLDNFCDFLLLHHSYIRRNKDCPNDIKEAVSSLIFASSRCGELPELLSLRILFGKRYGQQFNETASKLLPGNLVNSEIKERLSVASKTITGDLKRRLSAEIGREYEVAPKPLVIEYPLKPHHQQIVQVLNTNEECQLEACRDINNMEETKQLPSSPEALPHVADDMISYLDDDIEEVASSFGSKDSDHSPDQRIFKFKSTPLLPKPDHQVDDTNSTITKYPSISTSISAATPKVKPTRKRRRCRNPARGSSKMEDEYLSYYDSPCKKSSRHATCPHCKRHVAVERQTKLPDVRAMTMPAPARPEDPVKDSVARSQSLPSPACPRHVHPKLPDYDELAAKFMAYKEEYQHQRSLA